MQTQTAKNTAIVKAFDLDLDRAMSANISRKNIPNYTIPLLSALLSEAQHGIAYTGNLYAYLDQVAHHYQLDREKWDEIDSTWIDQLTKKSSIEGLLALFSKALDSSLFQSYLELNAIKYRQLLSPEAVAIDQVICADFDQAATAFICACEGYQVTLYHHKGYSSDGAIDQAPYKTEISWVFTLLFPQVTVKESIYFVDEKRSNLESLLLEEVVDFDRTALIADDHGLLDVRSEALAKKFGYVVNHRHQSGLIPFVLDDKISTRKTPKEQMLMLMTEDKKTFVKASIHVDIYGSRIMVIDYQHPIHQVLMMNLEGYEHTLDKDFTKLLGDDDYCMQVDTTSIIANRYNFSANYYTKNSQTKSWLNSLSQFTTRELSDLVTFHRPPTPKPLQDDGEEAVFYEVVLSNLNALAHIDNPTKEVIVNASDSIRIANESLDYGDILFALKGDIGRVGLFTEEDNFYLAGKGFIVLRLKAKAILDGITPEYLVSYLADDHVKNYIRHLNTGAKVENIRMDDLKSIPVIVDKSFIKNTKFAIDALEEQRNKIKKEIEIYNKLKSSLSGAIAGSGEYIEEMPKPLTSIKF